MTQRIGLDPDAIEWAAWQRRIVALLQFQQWLFAKQCRSATIVSRCGCEQFVSAEQYRRMEGRDA